MWTKENPTESGHYWFFGDPFGPILPYSQHKPFKPGHHLVEVIKSSEKVTFVVYKNCLCYNMKGVWWDKKIERPQEPDLTMIDW